MSEKWSFKFKKFLGVGSHREWNAVVRLKTEWWKLWLKVVTRHPRQSRSPLSPWPGLAVLGRLFFVCVTNISLSVGPSRAQATTESDFYSPGPSRGQKLKTQQKRWLRWVGRTGFSAWVLTSTGWVLICRFYVTVQWFSVCIVSYLDVLEIGLLLWLQHL